jgi:hypothetical protein
MIWTALVAYLADKTRYRMPFMVLNAAITLTGLLLTAYHTNNAVRYFGKPAPANMLVLIY